MTNSSQKKAIDRIRKLLAIAKDGQGDAANAAEMAARLMAKYQIESVSDLETDLDPVGDNIDLYIELTKSSRIPWWKWELAWKVAIAASCKPYKLARRNGSELKGSGISFIGRRSDAQLCCYLFSYLARELKDSRKDLLPRLGSRRRHYVPGTSVPVVDKAYQRQWSHDFYAGAISILESRMTQARRDVMSGAWSENGSAPEPPSTTALARIDTIEQEVVQVAASMGLSYESAPRHQILAAEGWAEGIRAGNEIDLDGDHRALGEGLAKLAEVRKT